MKKRILAYLILAAIPLAVHADEGILLQRIIALEKHVAELEARLAPVLEIERVKEVVKQQQALAHERGIMDAEFYQRHDLDIIEKLYQTANKDWKAEDAKKAVALLTERYPRANRTGCAVLTLAQMSANNEQLDYLKQAIEKYGDCYYSNGVQVGAYARLYLAMRHKRDGKDKESAKLFEEIRTRYPDAVDHTGQLLTSHLKGME
jgi:hypothetical protein